MDAASLLTQFGAYGDPGRDPRMNVVTVAYLAVLRDVGASSPARTPPRQSWCRWRTCWTAARAGVRPPAHRAGRDRARARRARGLGLATAFVGSTFTLAELRAVYEAIWGVQLDAANFRRSVVAEDGGSSPPAAARSPARPAAGRPSSTGPAGRGRPAVPSIGSSLLERSRHESGRARQLRPAGRSADRGGRAPAPDGGRRPRRVHAASVKRTDVRLRGADP